MVSIADLKNGERFCIEGVVLGREIGKRLADMGFSAGVTGTVVRCALLGDPLQIRLMGYDVSIRRAEAAGVRVRPLADLGVAS